MKLLSSLTLFLGMSALSLANTDLYSNKISPDQAWKFLKASKYERLPHYKVTYKSFFSRLGENLLNFDSKRTVEEKNHFIPFQRKLIFPNGICVRGTWEIDSHSKDYTGQFKAGSKGVIIGRVASATGKIHYKKHRTIGLSGKVFPTEDPSDQKKMQAANFLVMNAGGGGINKEYVSEAFLTNAAPSTVPLRGLPLLRDGLAIAKAFKLADKRRDVRQLYQIAELGATAPFSSPKWMWLRADKKSKDLSHSLAKDDFREETKALIDERGELSFDIMVADELENEQPVYSKIGHVSFNEYVTSAACDQSIHFQHPPYRDDYAVPEVEQNPSKIRNSLN